MHAVATQLQRQVLVVGAGLSGLSCVRHLLAQGCEVRLLDTRQIPPGLAEVRGLIPAADIYFGDWPAAAFAGVDAVVVSPGVGLDAPALVDAAARGLPLLGDIELFARAATRPVLALSLIHI